MSFLVKQQLLADIFARLGLMERHGSGLSKICNWYKNEANYDNDMEPKFRSNTVEFTVTLPNLNFKASKNEALNEALNGNEKLLLSLFNKNPRMTQKCIMETTGLSRATVQRAIKRLTDIGCLQRAGSRKVGQWIVVRKD